MTDSRYLGGFMGMDVEQACWLEKNVEGWKYVLDIMARLACKHPQTAYAGLHKSLHQEWDFVQRTTPDIGTAFQPVEDALQAAFLLDLSKGATSQIPGRVVTCLPVNQAGIALPDPTQTVKDNWTASCVITGHLVAALRGTAEFWLGYHDLLIGEVRDEIRQRHAEDTETALGEAQAVASTEDARRMGQIMRTGAWLSVLPSTINGT